MDARGRGRKTAGGAEADHTHFVLCIFTGFSRALALVYVLNLIPYLFMANSTKKHSLKETETTNMFIMNPGEYVSENLVSPGRTIWVVQL